MEDKILIPYAPILVESTRSIGYSFEAAMADVIDNSIGKGAREVNVNFSSIDKQYVAIIDDACGMDIEELEMAMRYGSQSSLDERDEKDLGRFGLGLKTASLSQCRKLTVITKKNNRLNAARWDLDHIIAKGDWALIRYNEKEIDEFLFVDKLKIQDSGTIVIWEEFDRMANRTVNLQKTFDEKIDIARDHIALVFHRFTGGDNISGRVKIYFNNAILDTVDPFLTSHPSTQPLVEQTIHIENNEIKVKPYILPYISKMSQKDKKQIGDIKGLRQEQGFYIYRSKRLIIWGTWFRLIKQHELNKLARVRVDIPNSLDSIWEIDIKKSTASLPDIIKRNLVSIVDNTVGRSEKVYKYRGRKVSDDNIEHVWNAVDNRGSFQYVINRDLPIFKLLEDSLDEKDQNCLDSLIKMIEDTFPYEDVYYRKAQNQNSIQTTFLDFEEVYQMAVRMIDYIKQNDESVIEFIKKMDKYDCFLRHPDVIEKIREEYKNEK